MGNGSGRWMDWEVLREIGEGSFGKVYEIRRNNLGQIEKAALKVMSIPRSREEILALQKEGYDQDRITRHYKDCLEEIIREYSLMVELKGHSNVVCCDDLRYFRHNDGVGWDIFIRMELLTPMDAVLAQEYDEEQTIRLAKDICAALVLCRKNNILHRDIKPQNIFASRTGDFKLGDFGVAKISERTAKGTIAGTYDYMAPEVFRGKPYGLSADVYSLGIVLYWIMNGKRMPFITSEGEIPTPQERERARYRRLQGEALPEPRYGSDTLKKIVLKACAFDPNVRYASADEMLLDLQNFKAPVVVPLPANEPPVTNEIETAAATPGQEGERKRKHRWLPWLLLALLSAIVAGFFTVHVWTEADCLSAETCLLCGKERGEPLGHNLRDATCTDPAYCRACGTYVGEELGHEPAEVLCSEVQHCVRCNEVLREATEHQMKGDVCTEATMCTVCGFLKQAAGHQMTSASCTEAAVCSVCGYTEGIVPGHVWMNATCTEPEICSICSETRGEAEGHRWNPATCTEPETCAVCGLAQGEVRAHEWTDATVLLPETCSLCGETRGTSIPVALTDCDLLEDSNPGGQATDVIPGDWKDCLGTVYENAIRFWTCNRAGWVNTEHAVYALNGAYETMHGIITAENNCESGARSLVRIYLDGELVYTSVFVDRGSAPVEFTLDVSGVQEVRVESYCDTFQFAYCLLQAELYNS